MRNLLKNC